MAKLEHKNLFHHGSASEVYAALQRDFDRDTWIQAFWRLVLGACAAGAALLSNHIDWLWIFGGLMATERAIAAFIDNSNRNWAMHVIDWMEAHRNRNDGSS